ncbi:MAG: hypothetical protein J3R72DRAFT_445753 [Linnemannia gamsii]|nr:MAG: hypothetical protein J3R72DRAFT_445753 [Linnemannia gamsii]
MIQIVELWTLKLPAFKPAKADRKLTSSPPLSLSLVQSRCQLRCVCVCVRFVAGRSRMLHSAFNYFFLRLLFVLFFSYLSNHCCITEKYLELAPLFFSCHSLNRKDEPLATHSFFHQAQAQACIYFFLASSLPFGKKRKKRKNERIKSTNNTLRSRLE